MVTCTCGKTIESIPDWMQRVQVDFVCNNCPNRSTKNIAIVSAEIDKRLAEGGSLGAATMSADEFPDEEEEE